jgi:hypothetical protein
MPIQINEDSKDGKFLIIRIHGVLTQADYEPFVREFEQCVRQHGKLRVLIDLVGFHGWEPAALWEEIKFDVRHLSDIERLAEVGNRQWQKLMVNFSRPFIKASIHYFDETQIAEARAWLAEV